MYLHRLDLASDPAKNSDIAAIVMVKINFCCCPFYIPRKEFVFCTQHDGLAHVCLLTSQMTVTRSRIERRMPQKKIGENAVHKARLKFFIRWAWPIRSRVRGSGLAR